MNSSKYILLVLYGLFGLLLWTGSGFAARAFHLEASSLLIGFYVCGAVVVFLAQALFTLLDSGRPVWKLAFNPLLWPLMVVYWIVAG